MPPAHGPLHIGLTGGIGSGKSTVATMLAGLGAALIDTDAIARELTAAGGAALPALRATFGDEVLDAKGGLDRSAMRHRAFADTAVRRRLEGILHPLIGAEARRRAEAATADVVVVDVPLLVESSHWRSRVDRVLVIDCTTETQISRVAARPGWTAQAAAAVIASQAPRPQRRAVADAVIFNDGLDLPGLQAHTEALWHLWKNSRSTT